MPVNVGLAQLSDHFLLATVFFYAMAVLAYAGDFAFGRRGGKHGRPGGRRCPPRRWPSAPGSRWEPESPPRSRPSRRRPRHRTCRPATGRSGGDPGRGRHRRRRRAGRGRAEPLARGRAARRALDPGGAGPDRDRARQPDLRHRHPRHRRAPGPVGQHVRVRHGDHLHGGDRVPGPVVPVPGLLGRALPDGADRARARAVRHRPVHGGRPAGPRAALLLDLDPRHRDDRGDRLLHRRGDLHRPVPGRGPARPQAGDQPGRRVRRGARPASQRRTPWTGSPTGP